MGERVINMEANANLKIVVFSQTERVKVINITTFDGLDSEIDAFGFTEKGEPVTNPEQLNNVKYRVTGLSHAGVNLNNVYSRGLCMDHKHVPDGYDEHGRQKSKLVLGKHLHGWDAVAMQLGRNGCHADPKTIQEATENLIRSGITRIHYFREANICGMAQSYGMFEDKWIVSGDVPEVNYDVFNKLLKSLKSPWRIQTPNTMKLLRKLELQRLTQETENL
jgi:hypothetical protein